MPAVNDRFFVEAVRPYCWFAALLLFLSYVIGLWFTLRTHAAVIWSTELDEKKVQLPPGPSGSITHQQSQAFHNPAAKQRDNGSIKGSISRNDIRESQLYRRILDQSLNQVGINNRNAEDSRQPSVSRNAQRDRSPQTPHLVPPKSSGDESTAVADNASQRSIHVAGLSVEDNVNLVRQVAEIAATAAAVAARDATTAPRKTSFNARTAAHHSRRSTAPGAATYNAPDDETGMTGTIPQGESGGHDAPNWSRLKSSIILLGATVLYAVIAEILVNTVDVVLESVDIDEKFLGITLFALVPNTTEFLVSLRSPGSGSLADRSYAERHIFRYEWQYRSFHGNRISVRIASLSTSDSRSRLVQCILWWIHGSTGCYRPHFCVRHHPGIHYYRARANNPQPYLPSMGYGMHRNSRDVHVVTDDSRSRSSCASSCSAMSTAKEK